ncbi:MAG: UDP-N-acetylmuramoyl-L-alanine--D-glutamate ligase [Chloroflexi bacterium]|nr:UDP-N-acetylmuramoyl-L-alanine--D-glutamate ligase [Chloroflexota bacterium]
MEPVSSLGMNLDFRDKRVTVVGLGVEGVDVVRFLARRGAYITVSDAKPREKLAARIEEVADLPVRLSLGTNDPADIADADAVFVSQGVPLELPVIVEARRRGLPVWSMLTLFMELCPGPIVGITGSSGKTTTTALLGETFRLDGRPHFVGGNIGVGLLDHLDEIRAYTWVILEVSHTQLQFVQRSPHIAAVLNVTPNHLDRFSWDEYRALKGNILRYQRPSDFAVLGYDDAEARSLADQTAGQPLFFTLASQVPGDGMFVQDGQAVWRRNSLRQPLFPLESLRLRGRHNQTNAVAAAALAAACGLEPGAIADAVATFTGVEHRLEFMATVDGADYYNDSIATTPERTLAALRSFSEPLILLLGGRDKHLPLEEMAEEACRRCQAIVCFGESAPKLAEAVEKARADARPSGRAAAPAERRPVLATVGTLGEAVEAAHGLARAGDVVLLSPACTSFDAYDNFEERARHFRELVLARTKEAEPSLT